MLVTSDNATLIIAESYGKRLSAFDIAADGGLSGRRIWADLGDGVPDGICLDGEGAVWYADVPNKSCVRVREGGEVLQRIELDRGCFACVLGGSIRSTLFMMGTEWKGPAGMFAEPRTGQVLYSPGARTARRLALGSSADLGRGALESRHTFEMLHLSRSWSPVRHRGKGG